MENILLYKMDEFEGPLDLLLQLIARNKLNIYDIKISVLVEQYLEQINLMKENEMDVSSEFLEMASRLLYIKTVSLLPKHEEAEQLKQELTGELLEFSICKQVAEKFATMTDGFDTFVRPPEPFEADKTYVLSHDSVDIYNAYITAMGRMDRRISVPTKAFTKIVAKKIYSVSSKIIFVMRNLWGKGRKNLNSLYASSRDRSELVATFLAILELAKANRVRISGDSENTEIELIKEKKRNAK
ncbi:MAG: serine protease [Ruminococcaceae bacterium]|nr:serine protease [Oscillospiraceae bacterium]